MWAGGKMQDLTLIPCKRNIAELADSKAELLATPAPPPKRPIGFINPEDKGKKAQAQRKG